LKNPHVSSVITGASRADQVVENMKAVEVAKSLSTGVMAKIEKILANAPQAEPDFRSW
jgi:aryl-alcohol dehydrogenase-like predicted oxidoreductase